MLEFPTMGFLQGALPYVQIVLSVLLIGAIILQRTGASLGGAFGADNFSPWLGEDALLCYDCSRYPLRPLGIN